MFLNDWYISSLCILAVWRVTHLLNAEDGPFEIVYQLRKKAGAGFFGSLLDCFYCVSVWTALPLAIWQGHNWWQVLLFWWAYSGAACLLEQATTRGKQHNKPDFFED
jgi:hypothetical protein